MIEKFFKKNILQSKIYIPGKSKVDKPINVIKLSSNENPYPACNEIYDFLKNYKNLNIYPDEHPSELLNEISKFIKLNKENILITNGSDEGLDLIFKGFIEKNDSVLIFTPTFSLYEILSKIYGAKVIKINLIEKESSFEYPKDISNAVKKMKPKLIIVCTPNNPTGNVIEEDFLNELLNLDSIIVLDEAYAEFASKTYTKLVKSYENIICLRTFSKAFGLAGIRLGYIVADPKVIDYLNRAKLPFNVNSLAQKIGAIAIRNYENYYKNIIREIIKTRQYVYERLKNIRGIKPFKSEANFILIKSLNGKGNIIYRELLKRGIIIRTCESFGLNVNYLRVTIGKRYDMELFIKTLEEIMNMICTKSS